MKAGKNTRTGQKRTRARSPVRETQERNVPKQAAKAVVVPFSSPATAQQTAETVPSTAVVTFEADCTARYAEQLKATLLERADVEEQVSLDVGAIERIDTVFLQLLTAFVRDRIQAGRSIVWKGDNDVFSQAAGLLGLTAILNLGDAA